MDFPGHAGARPFAGRPPRGACIYSHPFGSRTRQARPDALRDTPPFKGGHECKNRCHKLTELSGGVEKAHLLSHGAQSSAASDHQSRDREGAVAY